MDKTTDKPVTLDAQTVSGVFIASESMLLDLLDALECCDSILSEFFADYFGVIGVEGTPEDLNDIYPPQFKQLTSETISLRFAWWRMCDLRDQIALLKSKLGGQSDG